MPAKTAGSKFTSPALVTIKNAHLAEPLVRTASTTPTEDKALATALTAYQRRGSNDDFSALSTFVANNPNSGWSAAVSTNLGLGYLHAGYFSPALESLRRAYALGKDASAVDARSLIDRAVGEQAQLLAVLGKFDELTSLFAELGKRPITGSATEQVQVARETLTLVDKDPRHLFLCGPRALKAMLLARGLSDSTVFPLEFYRATAQGTSLEQLGSLAQKMKLDYPACFQENRAIPFPNKLSCIGRWAILQPSWGAPMG